MYIYIYIYIYIHIYIYMYIYIERERALTDLQTHVLIYLVHIHTLHTLAFVPFLL